MLAIGSFMSAGNHSTKATETHWNIFGFKNKNNLIDLIENSKRHALVGEVLIIRKLKCKNRGHYKLVFSWISIYRLCSTVSQHLNQ